MFLMVELQFLVSNGNNESRTLLIGFQLFINKWLKEENKILHSLHITIGPVDGNKIGS